MSPVLQSECLDSRVPGFVVYDLGFGVLLWRLGFRWTLILAVLDLKLESYLKALVNA